MAISEVFERVFSTHGWLEPGRKLSSRLFSKANSNKQKRTSSIFRLSRKMGYSASTNNFSSVALRAKQVSARSAHHCKRIVMRLFAFPAFLERMFRVL